MNLFNLSTPLVATLAFVAALGIAMADDWAAGGALCMVLQWASALVAVTYLLARFIFRPGLPERQSDTDLLERIGRVLRLPAIADSFVFLAITIALISALPFPHRGRYPTRWNAFFAPEAGYVRQWLLKVAGFACGGRTVGPQG